MTNREQTKEQFSTATTADGNRLDRAMRDIVAFWNSVPKRNRQRRYVQTQLVGGFMMGAAQLRSLPFMSVANTAYFYNPTAPSTTQNFWRFKGTRNNYIDPRTADPTRDRILVWSPRMAFSKGAILDSIAVELDRDVYSIAPSCSYDGNDLTVIVDVDDRWTPDTKRTTAVQYLFNRGSLRSMWSHDVGKVLVHANTLLPPYAPSFVRAFNSFFGFALEDRGLNIALPEACSIRIGIVIPRYAAGGHGWTTEPWTAGSWSWTATFLEEVE